MFASRVVVILFVLSFLAIAVPAPEKTPKKPIFPDKFIDPHTYFVVQQGYKGGDLVSVNGTMNYDGRMPAWSLNGSQSLGGMLSQIGFLFLPNTSFQTNNGICRESAGAADALWTWIPFASYEGNKTVNGRFCQVWALESDGVYLETCAQGDIPVYLLIFSYDVAFSENVTTSWYFSEEFLAGSVNTSTLEAAAACFAELPVCDNNTVFELTMYRFHEPYDYVISNTNLASLLGDTAFVCYSITGGLYNQYTWISAFSILVNASWGQYALCNSGSCFGGSLTLVGHEATFGVTPGGGQCTNDSAVGDWFSLPVAGMCDDNQPIGTNGCSWKLNNVIKSINASCLYENGFTISCVDDGGFPYASSTQQFSNAFTYSDPSQGGCPNIYPGKNALQ